MESVIEVRGLALAFGEGPSATTVFSDIDLTVAAGEFLVIVGASGVGKSTLLRVLAGLIPATSGRVLLHTPADPARLPVALAFQDARLLPWRRVLENVKFGIERLAVGGKERSERAAAALDLVGLSALAQRWPHQLSGGQRQRVALARALAVQPYILLMDEPFGALDAITRESLQDELLRVWHATGKTIIFVTHDISEAVYLADRVVLLAGSPGRIRSTHMINARRPRSRGHAEQKKAAESIRDGLGLIAGEGI